MKNKSRRKNQTKYYQKDERFFFASIAMENTPNRNVSR
jgi:hypothetical protein